MLRVSKLLLCVLLFIAFSGLARAQGILLRGIGAVNDSMAGTAIATPLDAAGAINANPASISGLQECQIGFDLGVIIPNSTVTSEIVGVSATRATAYSDAGQIPAPTMSMVYRNCPHSRFTFGLAIAGVGGAASLYSATDDGSNPILGGKARAANVQIFEILPTVSYRVTDRLALGFSPVIGLASLSINPMPLGLTAGAPIDNYGTRYTWGGGFNVGLYYDLNCNWKTGFTFKSPVWTKSLQFIGTNTNANTGIITPSNPEFAIDLPMSLGWGVSYRGISNTVIGVDVRYMDYANTKGFRDIVGDNGTVIGLGWDSVWAVSTGIEHTLTDRLKLRAGYCYNTNPIPSESQHANVGSPLMMQHVLGLGCTIGLPKSLDAHLAWTHAFQKEESGLGQTAGGYVKVTNTAHADTLIAGITKRF
ncbi:MAG: outer membrane protein transport protein [Planctomycetaceae bacterium]|nr:outer membrane protein transport protein [Planctomycetaceae bacterium]